MPSSRLGSPVIRPALEYDAQRQSHSLFLLARSLSPDFYTEQRKSFLFISSVKSFPCLKITALNPLLLVIQCPEYSTRLGKEDNFGGLWGE